MNENLRLLATGLRAQARKAERCTEGLEVVTFDDIADGLDSAEYDPWGRVPRSTGGFFDIY